MSTYKVNLVSLHNEQVSLEYHLDDTFFSTNNSYAISSGDVDVRLKASLTGNVYSFSLHYCGEIETPCDRCLDSVYYDVDFTREFVVKLTDDEYQEEDDVINVPRKNGFIDLAEIMAEDLSLSLPMVAVHKEGECNEEMIAKYEAMKVDEMPEEKAEKDEENVDVRWAALKQLKKN